MQFVESHVRVNKLNVQKRTSSLHSSTEGDIDALDADLRMDGMLALWDLVIGVFHSSPLPHESLILFLE